MNKIFFYIIFAALILSLLNSCRVLSLKNYKKIVATQDSLKLLTDYYKNRNNHLDSINIFTVNENSLLNKKIEALTVTIKNMSDHRIENEASIPVIPNPPPASTDFLKFEHILKYAKTYLQADQILSESFERNNMKKIYLAFQGKGFVVASTIDEIDYKGNKIREEISSPETVGSFVSNLFSAKHINELMFSKNGYYRWLVFIVSSDINNINGNEVDPAIIQGWVNHFQTKFPFDKLQNPMPNDTRLYALLYEFEQNNNLRGKLKLLKGTHITDMSTVTLIKAMKIKDHENN